MELDDLKNSWEQLSSQANNQHHLTPQIIEQMTKRKWDAQLNKIAYPEIIGALVCLGGAGYIAVNFSRLDNIYLQAAGIISIVLLLALPVISFISLRQLVMPAAFTKPYAETLKAFAVQQLRFHKLQKLNITLCYLLLVTGIILFSKIFGEKDLTANNYFWTFSFAVGYIFLLFYSKWVTKYYKHILWQAKELLKELPA